LQHHLQSLQTLYYYFVEASFFATSIYLVSPHP
jgi:hypothetical protein